MIDKFKDNLQVDELIKEAVSLNSPLLQQKEVIFQKISQISPYYKTNDKLTNRVIDMRLEKDEIHKRTSDFITWQESEDERKADLPKLKESHKDIMFTDWDSQLKQVERVAAIAMTTLNNIIEAINENLFGANLVKKCIPRFLLNFEQLEQQWRQATQEKEEAIRQVKRLNWEAYFQFLVKPHS